MELKDIRQLMADFEKSTTRELKIDNGDFHLYLSKNHENAQTSAAPDEGKLTELTKAEDQSTNNEDEKVKTVTAPLVGTVYLQPKPDAKPYVTVGDHVAKGDTVCVIEAMKMMTEIKTDFSGIVTGVKVENQDLVEVEQPLFTIKED